MEFGKVKMVILTAKIFFSFRILAKIKYLLNDYKGALMDLNRADKIEPDNHVILRYPALAFTICALSLMLYFRY